MSELGSKAPKQLPLWPEGLETKQHSFPVTQTGTLNIKRSTTETTPDDPSKIASGAVKYDGGKAAPFRGLVDYFPRAILAVAGVSTFGATKYAWKGWEGVEDGYARYSDALVRHLIAEGSGESLDRDSGLAHAAHAAWNALARLELKLREQEVGG